LLLQFRTQPTPIHAWSVCTHSSGGRGGSDGRVRLLAAGFSWKFIDLWLDVSTLVLQAFDRLTLLESVQSAQLALPPPASTASSISSIQTAPTGSFAGRAVQAADPRPEPKVVRGCSHLCEVLACRLPRERFWEKGSSSGAASSSSGGGNRSLPRR
jgi:hypothetical protein